MFQKSSRRRTNATGLVVLTACFLMAVPVAASAAPRDVAIVNHAASPIVEVYVSASTEDSWGDDRLGDEPVAPGRSWRLAAMPGRTCSVDIRVVYADGRTEERRQQDVCRLHDIAFDATGAVTLKAGTLRSVTFANATHRTIAEIYLSSSTSEEWGAGLLTRPVSPGASVRVQRDGGCVADLRVVFDNRAAEERRRIDICRNAQVAIRPGWTTTDDLAPADDATAGIKPDHRT